MLRRKDKKEAAPEGYTSGTSDDLATLLIRTFLDLRCGGASLFLKCFTVRVRTGIQY